jgi:hypothetical protein
MAIIGQRTGGTTVATASRVDGRNITPGTLWADEKDGRRYVQVSAASTITQYDIVWVDPNFTATSITPALAKTSGRVGVAQIAFASGDNGPVVIDGPVTFNVLGSCSKDIPLFTTDTAGSLDDATASASHVEIVGLMAYTNQSGSTASQATGFIANAWAKYVKDAV